MIDFYSWSPYLRIIFLLAPFVIGLCGLAVQAYITHRYYDRVISAFPNSLGVRNYQRMWAGFDFVSRYMQVSITGGFVLLPNMHIRKGTLDPEEVRKFPPEIKKLMTISISLLLVGMSWLALAIGLLKLTKS